MGCIITKQGRTVKKRVTREGARFPMYQRLYGVDPVQEYVECRAKGLADAS